MKRRYIALFLLPYILAVGSFAMGSDQATSVDNGNNTNKLDWRLGPTSYAFRKFTFFEAVDKTKALGMKYIEPFEGHRISNDSPEGLVRKLSDEKIAKVLRKLEDAGVRMKSIYIGKVPNDEAGCREVFEFVHKLGIGTIVAEPPESHLDTIEKFCDEYKINLALHNHPAPSRYWHPRTVLKACKGRSRRIGACPDLGHWQRSGIKPVDGLCMLQGRILSLHVKDLNQFKVRKAHDVPWGTGKGEIEMALEEVKRQGLEPAIFGIEYEYHSENLVPEIGECVKFFKQVDGKINR
ncbi:MAG: TIM barrel protein [Pirellulales bacterium]|nr:TIM barrel protein [Pirellulales bacterium]